MIAIIDYGVGNLFSLKSSFAAIGEETIVTDDRALIGTAGKVILPGVGAFGDAVEKLRERGLFDFVREQALSGKPFLGICLGMQLLFDSSLEFGVHEGLGLIPGQVRPISDVIPPELDIPHMGWNRLDLRGKDAPGSLFADLPGESYVYFVHSFAAFGCEENLTATAGYGVPLTAAVQKGNVYGTQFHPEKSGETGLAILRAFAAL